MFRRNMPFFKESGQVAVIVAIIITVLIGMVALVVDVGSLYEDRSHLQTVADAAALAGAQDLPEDPVMARLKAVAYANSNGVAIDPYDNVDLVNNDTIEVTPVEDAKLYFAPVLGVNSASVSATATATAYSPVEMSRLVPWGVLEADISPPGESITMMAATPIESGRGYFGAMHFENSYKDNIVNGCTEEIIVGEDYNIEPVNVEETIDGVNERISGTENNFDKFVGNNGSGVYYVKDATCPRIVIVPVIEDFAFLDPDNPIDDVEVVKFGVFFIDSIDTETANLSGKFVTYMIAVTSGDTIGYTGGIDTSSIKVIRLIE